MRAGNAVNNDDYWSFVRSETIGLDAVIDTAMGRRVVTYADFTASGRAVHFVEEYILENLKLYGNTHTEDDATGRVTGRRLAQAESMIKRLVNAGQDYHLIAVGAGTTAAVHRLQQILGVYVPPAAKDFFRSAASAYLPTDQYTRLADHLLGTRPVVFIGPYEHHSNEVSWRECFAEVVEVELDAAGFLDLEDLRRKVSAPAYRNRRKMGAFSAASNVTGIITPIYEVARILHQHGALAFADFAASAPYRPIDVRRDAECFFDAIYFSPHKFLGGPGSAGILIIHDRIYRRDLPPTVAAGGTVEFVGPHDQVYFSDIEMREKSGTPGIVQTMRAALAMELKETLGTESIERREREYIRFALEHLRKIEEIEIIGNPDPDRRLAIVSFNVRARSSYLHPRFVTSLLNDLFGIQSRAGCSCAGPYGHRVLGIDEHKSTLLKNEICLGHKGIKPGWVRLNFHFLLTRQEVEFICEAVEFVAEFGQLFLPLYRFDPESGAWSSREGCGAVPEFGLAGAMAARESSAPERESMSGARDLMHRSYIDEATRKAWELKAQFDGSRIETAGEHLFPFVYAREPYLDSPKKDNKRAWGLDGTSLNVPKDHKRRSL